MTYVTKKAADPSKRDQDGTARLFLLETNRIFDRAVEDAEEKLADAWEGPQRDAAEANVAQIKAVRGKFIDAFDRAEPKLKPAAGWGGSRN